MIATRLALAIATAFLLGSASTARAAAPPLRVNGSTTVNPIVVEAAEILRSEGGVEIQVDTQGGSSGGLAALGDGRADVAMSSRPLKGSDREKFPGTDFHATVLGYDAVALVVSRDVWEGGVRALSRQQVQALYEGRVRNWKELGGPDRRVVFFNKEPGRGTWEVFADWLYGKADAAPLVNHPEVGANEEARTKVASTRGSISQLSTAWADGERVFALALLAPSGGSVAPTREHIADGTWPMARSLFLITDGEPRGTAKVLIDFLLSPRGQELLPRHGYLPLGSGQSGAPGRD